MSKVYYKDEASVEDSTIYYAGDGENHCIGKVTESPDGYMIHNVLPDWTGLMENENLIEIDEQDYGDVFLSVDSVGSRPDIPPQ